MKKRGMKIGSFLLCLVMLLSMAVVGASAATKGQLIDLIGSSEKKIDTPDKLGLYTTDSLEKFKKALTDAQAADTTDKDAVNTAYTNLNNAKLDLCMTVGQAGEIAGIAERALALDITKCSVEKQAAYARAFALATKYQGTGLLTAIRALQADRTDSEAQEAVLKIMKNITKSEADDALAVLQEFDAIPCESATTTTTTVVDDTTTVVDDTTTVVDDTTAPVGAVDKSMLQALYTLNANRIENLYTEASWAKFARAMDTAKAVLDDPNATQAQVRSAFINLKIAISCLEKAPLCVSTTAAPVCTTAAPVCTTVAPATTCVPVATTCAPVATTCAPVATTCYPVVPTTCVPVVTTTAAPAVVETTCYPVVPTTCVPVVTTTAAPAVVETTCVTVIVTPTVIVTVPVVATTAAPADIDVPDTGVESDMALLLLVASAAIVGVIILKKKVTA